MIDVGRMSDRRGQRSYRLALFTEAPGNPLLKTPDLMRIRALAEYDFAVVVDETLGNFLNINVLQYADIVASSLTKIFSGDSNVMGGSAILNPHGRCYQILKQTYDGSMKIFTGRKMLSSWKGIAETSCPKSKRSTSLPKVSQRC